MKVHHSFEIELFYNVIG